MSYFGSRTSRWSIALLALLSFAAAGCSDDTTTGPSTDDPVANKEVLEDVGTDVILATYTDLDTEAGGLVAAVTAFNADPTDLKLSNARLAWISTRRPWEQSEAFLFGPVDTKGIDPGIDSWPVNKADLDAVLASSATLTKDYIDGLEGTLKGFHTIEYLLFGSGTLKTASQITPREREYLIAVTQSFKGATNELRASWDPAGENFVGQLINAGASGSIYTSQGSALQELVNGMAAICDEVANGKIADPYNQQDRSLEESQFSDNSNADFQDNIRSVRNMYRGSYEGPTGKGIGAIVAARNPALHTRVQNEIDAAITAIGAMQPTFGRAIFDDKPKVEAAMAAVNTLKATLEGEVLSTVTGN